AKKSTLPFGKNDAALTPSANPPSQVRESQLQLLSRVSRRSSIDYARLLLLNHRSPPRCRRLVYYLSEMTFFFGVVIGIVCGIAAVILFLRCQNARSKQRSDLAATIAAFARMTVEDSRKLLPPPYYPAWVVFSESQKLTWLNAHLTKIWPYVDQAASLLIRESVDPILEEYRPVILSSLKFSKLTLGTVAPQFTGVSIIEDGGDGITVELEVNWDGNPNIVKNIGFTGVFRLIFNPLVEEFPGFGAISFSLRKKKQMDFTLKVVGGDLSSIPGIYDAIEGTIRDAIEDSITWPIRKVIPILPGDYSDLELKPDGILRVKLVQARHLTNKDLIGKSDPFTELYVRPIHAKTKKSKVINNDLNPIWNEHFEFVVEEKSTQILVVKIYDYDKIQDSELIGCAQFQLKDLQPGKVKEVWLKLVKDLEIQRDNKNRGEVHLELVYTPKVPENGFTNPYDPKVSFTALERVLSTAMEQMSSSENGNKSMPWGNGEIIRGVLSVTLISAQGLPPADLNGKADPYVLVKMKKSETRNKTRVVHNSLDPVWNQTFDFLVEDGLHDMLMLEVWDHDTFGKDYLGTSVVTLTRVITEGEYSASLALEGAKGRLNVHLKWTPQYVNRNT
ncbi:hypothetical protein V2J09_000277, partial [Rumex salicifolius]